MFGGNSNWRGPIWFPINFLIIESLQRFHHYYSDDFKIEYPTNSGKYLTLNEIADELTKRLEKKSFDIAKQYYITERYQAAIMAFDIFIEDNFGTNYKEEALAYKFLASYELGIKSIITKKEQRINNAIAAYNRLKKSFPKSNKLNKFSSKFEELNKELTKTKEIYAKYTNNGL